MTFALVAAGGIALVGAGLSYASSRQQAKASEQAAETQVQSADRAALLQQQQYEQTRQDLAPWRETGGRALGGLEALAGQPLQGPAPYQAPAPFTLQAPYQPGTPYQQAPVAPGAYQFTPPTGADVMQDPGYQFRLSEGRRLLEGGAAARGLLQSGGTLRGVTQLGQDLASQEYGNVYQRRLGENQQQYARAIAQNQEGYTRGNLANEQQYARDYAQNQQFYTRGAAASADQYQRGLQQYQLNAQTPLQYRGQQYNELAGLAGTGQTATNQTAQLGAGYAGNVGDLYTQAGNAQSAGIIGAQNAQTAGIQGAYNAAQSGLGNYLTIQQAQQRQNYATPAYGILPTRPTPYTQAPQGQFLYGQEIP